MTSSVSETSFVTPQELQDLADYLPEAGQAMVAALVARQTAALAAGPAQTARKMLALVEALGEYDDQVASHLLIGVLRIASGVQTLAVERTALRIAGLATVNGDTFVLSGEGQAMIQSLVPGIEVALSNADTAISARQPDQGHIPAETTPFAQMRFGEKLFEIAEAPLEDMLCFRLAGQKAWTALDRDRSAGWAEIGAEILTRSTDVLSDYITMHTVRLPEADEGPDVHRFDLDNLRWWIRAIDGKAQFLADRKGVWQELPGEDPMAEPIRAIGIRAARTLIPGFEETIQPHAALWVRRMAHAATVSPILSSAA